MFLSAAMIVKNESRCIIRCLSSIINAVDEIIIVDTGSTDQTVELIEEYRKSNNKVRLYHYEWNDDFAAARNFSLSKTKGDWILSIDADEFLADEDVKQLKHYCKLALQNDLGVKNIMGDIELIDIIDFQIANISKSGVVRLFTSGMYYKGAIHEQLQCDKVSARVSFPVRIFHDGYDGGVVDRIAKRKRNIQMLEHAINEDPSNPQHFIYLAREVQHIKMDFALKCMSEARRLIDLQDTKNENLNYLFGLVSGEIQAKLGTK